MNTHKDIPTFDKIMVFGSAASNRDDGTLYLSEVGVARAERTAELYESDQFDRDHGKILIAGGYGKHLESAGRDCTHWH